MSLVKYVKILGELSQAFHQRKNTATEETIQKTKTIYFMAFLMEMKHAIRE